MKDAIEKIDKIIEESTRFEKEIKKQPLQKQLEWRRRFGSNQNLNLNSYKNVYGHRVVEGGEATDKIKKFADTLEKAKRETKHKNIEPEIKNQLNNFLKVSQRKVFKKPLQDKEFSLNERETSNHIRMRALSKRMSLVDPHLKASLEHYKSEHNNIPGGSWAREQAVQGNKNINIQHGGGDLRLKSLLGIHPKNSLIDNSSLANVFEKGIQVHTMNKLGGTNPRAVSTLLTPDYASKAVQNNTSMFDYPVQFNANIQAKYLRAQPGRPNYEAGISHTDFNKLSEIKFRRARPPIIRKTENMIY